MLSIASDRGHVRRIYTDGRGSSVSAVAESSRELVVAGWERGSLVVETNSDGGPRLLRRYSLTVDGKQMLVTTQVGWAANAQESTISQVFQRRSIAAEADQEP